MKNYELNTNKAYLEFGVYKGNSMRLVSKYLPNKKKFGFDSFAGFPGDGRFDWKKNFTLNNPPKFNDQNITIIKGFFEQTLPVFFQKKLEIDLINIDCDIFSSTETILNNAGHKIDDKCLIYFDEAINYPLFFNNEIKALYNYMIQQNRGCDFIAITNNIFSFEKIIKNLKKKNILINKKLYRQGLLIKFSGQFSNNSYGPIQLDHYRKKIKFLTKNYLSINERKKKFLK